MNSIVQEASSIAKAIEQAWVKAEKPQRFSIRIFEQPEKNFFGMVSKPAKIALLFEKRDIRKQPVKEVVKKQIQPKPKLQSKPVKQAPPEKKPTVPAEKKQKILWTDEMVSKAEKWMKGILVEMNKKNIPFSFETKRYHLKFLFSDSVFESPEKQKVLFRNFAHLIMQSIRNKFKKKFRYHKVVISSEK